jgi:hypothetical protein
MIITHAGIPGTSMNLNGRDIRMFPQEKDHLEAQDKLLDFFIYIFEQCTQTQNLLSNANFTRFYFTERLKVPKDEKNNPIYDDALMKRVNAIQVSTNTQFAKQNYSSNDPNTGATVNYKMLKCDSKLVKFVFELNGLVSTDRHDWDTLWTHTTGKSYFYERLSSEQKVNHFPVSIELTRKDNLAINIRKM